MFPKINYFNKFKEILFISDDIFWLVSILTPDAKAKKLASSSNFGLFKYF
jgi:hypothetical protein